MTYNEVDYKHIQRITLLMDGKFSVGGMRFGLDPIIGLVPVLGDILPVLISGYLIWCAKNLGVSNQKIWTMVWNVALDFLVGLVPVLGDIADFTIKANQKNLRIINNHLGLTN